MRSLSLTMRHLLLLAPLVVSLPHLGESKKPSRGKSQPHRSSFKYDEALARSRRPSAEDWDAPMRDEDSLPDILSDAEYFEDEEYPADDRDMDEGDDVGFEMPSFKSAASDKGGEINDRLSSGVGKEALYDAYNQLHTLAQVR
jgi:hypothetical protein